MLVDCPGRNWGWNRGSPTIGGYLEHGRRSSTGADRIAPGGRFIFSDRYLYLTHDNVGETLWSGIFAVDVRSGAEKRENVHHHSAGKPGGYLQFGGSPDGTRIALRDQWSMPLDPRPSFEGLSPEQFMETRYAYERHVRECLRYTLTIASFDGSPSREILTKGVARLSELVGAGADSHSADTPVQ